MSKTDPLLLTRCTDRFAALGAAPRLPIAGTFLWYKADPGALQEVLAVDRSRCSSP